jgi:hypothetical protein
MLGRNRKRLRVLPYDLPSVSNGGALERRERAVRHGGREEKRGWSEKGGWGVNADSVQAQGVQAQDETT